MLLIRLIIITLFAINFIMLYYNFNIMQASTDENIDHESNNNNNQIEYNNKIIEETNNNNNKIYNCALQRSLVMKQMKSRSELPQLLNELNLINEAVEIGVNEGDFSEYFLSKWKGKLYHLVDPWQQQNNETYDDINNQPQHVQDAKLNKVKKRLSNYKDRYQINRGFSVEVSKNFSDNSLDFIYVDARHDYEGVLEDLDHWFPKLKVGGLIAGHDFVPDGTIREGKFGVQGAVHQFFKNNQREVLSIATKDKNGGRSEPQHLDGGWTTWYTFK